MVRFQRQPPGTAITRSALVVGGVAHGRRTAGWSSRTAPRRRARRRGGGGPAAGRRPPGEPRSRWSRGPDAHRAARPRVGRRWSWAPSPGSSAGTGARRSPPIVALARELPVLLRPGARRRARVLRGGEPRDARAPLRARRLVARGWPRRGRSGSRPRSCPSSPRSCASTQVAHEERARERRERRRRVPRRSGGRLPAVSRRSTGLARALPTPTGRALFGAAGAVAGTSAPRTRDDRGGEPGSGARTSGRRPARAGLHARGVPQLRAVLVRHVPPRRTWSDEQVRAAFAVDGFEHMREPVERGQGVDRRPAAHGELGRGGPRDVRRTASRSSRSPRSCDRHGCSSCSCAPRERLGMRIVGHAGGASVADLHRGARGAGDVVALVADRDLAGRGVEVEMFGALAAAAGRSGAARARHRCADRHRRRVPDGATGWSVTFRPLPEVERDRRPPRRRRSRSPESSPGRSSARSRRRRRTGTCSSPPGRREGRAALCPYAWDDPGGVQVHVRELAERLLGARARGARPGAGARRPSRAVGDRGRSACRRPVQRLERADRPAPVVARPGPRRARDLRSRRRARPRADRAVHGDVGDARGARARGRRRSIPGPTARGSTTWPRPLLRRVARRLAVADRRLGARGGVRARRGSAARRRDPQRRRRRAVREPPGRARTCPTGAKLLFVGRLDERKGFAVAVDGLRDRSRSATPICGSSWRVTGPPATSCRGSCRRSASASCCSGTVRQPGAAPDPRRVRPLLGPATGRRVLRRRPRRGDGRRAPGGGERHRRATTRS